ncbi:hypothetical protein [Spongiactinospora sp. TRM90649]|uniref:hypothetical protein n=1 Tax=Spongiactinospora sp. TRM90649 TaxID=3031114 RepID=UPI0023F97C70|nr:hypothetical protein [Spongiactinospora sp. TRM90649]MDF5753357.1 hypothetical protein [Spongiactinospora sp. TRM90649]
MGPPRQGEAGGRGLAVHDRDRLAGGGLVAELGRGHLVDARYEARHGVGAVTVPLPAPARDRISAWLPAR